MSALAASLTERVTLLERDAARDDLGSASNSWADGATVWAAMRPDGAAAGDDAGPLPRWTAVLRAGPTPERLRWRGQVLAVRRTVRDPAAPDRVTLFLEVLR